MSTTVLAVAGGLYLVLGRSDAAPVAKAAPAAYAPYVDVTLTPTYAFEDTTSNSSAASMTRSATATWVSCLSARSCVYTTSGRAALSTCPSSWTVFASAAFTLPLECAS